MIGTKKLSEIRAELRQAYADDPDFPQWIDREIERLRRKGAAGRSGVEVLTILRNGLLKETRKPKLRAPKKNRRVAARGGRIG